MKQETKTIFKSILQKGSQNHIIFGETHCKNKIINIDFSKIWIPITPTAKHIPKNYDTNYYTMQPKQITIYTKSVETRQT